MYYNVLMTTKEFIQLSQDGHKFLFQDYTIYTCDFENIRFNILKTLQEVLLYLYQ